MLLHALHKLYAACDSLFHFVDLLNSNQPGTAAVGFQEENIGFSLHLAEDHILPMKHHFHHQALELGGHHLLLDNPLTLGREPSSCCVIHSFQTCPMGMQIRTWGLGHQVSVCVRRRQVSLTVSAVLQTGSCPIPMTLSSAFLQDPWRYYALVEIVVPTSYKTRKASHHSKQKSAYLDVLDRWLEANPCHFAIEKSHAAWKAHPVSLKHSLFYHVVLVAYPLNFYVCSHSAVSVDDLTYDKKT